MLIKINESTPEFIQFVDDLKAFTNEATAAGATKQAIAKYVMYRKLWERERKKRERLENILADLKEMVHQRDQLNASIKIITG